MPKRMICLLLALALFASMHAFAAGQADTFDMDFVNYVRSNNSGENYIVSPLSYRAALLLALEGAGGETEAQLLRALNFEAKADAEAWYACVRGSVDEFADLREGYMYYDKTASEYAYRVLSSAWNNKDISGDFLDGYKRRATEKYGAEIRSEKALDITDAVNGWCDEATNGLIPKIAEDLSENACVLVNAVYLKSAWEDAFEKYRTSPNEFTCLDGSIVTKDMMKANDRYRYYEDGDSKLVVVHLRGGLDFVAVLGDDSDWMNEYALAAYDDVDLWLPKLDTQSEFGKEVLLGYLAERGAVNAFSPEKADFSGMSGDIWYIQNMLQKARIKTDEGGLEAAAVTMIAYALGAAPGTVTEPHYKVFHADRPFTYYITTALTETPLVVFAGQEVK